LGTCDSRFRPEPAAGRLRRRVAPLLRRPPKLLRPGKSGCPTACAAPARDAACAPPPAAGPHASRRGSRTPATAPLSPTCTRSGVARASAGFTGKPRSPPTAGSDTGAARRLRRHRHHSEAPAGAVRAAPVVGILRNACDAQRSLSRPGRRASCARSRCSYCSRTRSSWSEVTPSAHSGSSSADSACGSLVPRCERRWKAERRLICARNRRRTRGSRTGRRAPQGRRRSIDREPHTDGAFFRSTGSFPWSVPGSNR
jgi:hypothetical protein